MQIQFIGRTFFWPRRNIDETREVIYLCAIWYIYIVHPQLI